MYKVYCAGKLICDSRVDGLAIISPVVTLEANAAGSFKFTLPPAHPFYDAPKRKNTVISVYRDEDDEPIFQGIPVSEDVDFYKQKTIECEGELTYLNDSILRPAHREGLTVRQLLETYIAEHNAQVDDYKQFEVGVVTVTDSTDSITCYTNYQSTMAEIKEDLVDDLGGYIRIRYADGKKYIDYLAESPRTPNQIIKLGQNLTDYSSNIDDTEIITRIIPRGTKLDEQEIEGLDAYLTIASVNDGKDYLDNTDAQTTYGVISGVVDWSDVTVASILKSKAQKYLEAVQFENVELEISAVDMGYLSSDTDKFKVLDSIRVVSKTHGMDKYFLLTKQTINLNDPEKDKITLGKTEQKSLSEQTVSQNSEIKKQIENVPTSTIMKSVIENATNLITGNSGGYVVMHKDSDGKPYEILIMDTEDINTATKVWRWNKEGLGYSSTGYAGPYGLAMTSNGAIVADFITAGTIKGISLEGTSLTINASRTFYYTQLTDTLMDWMNYYIQGKAVTPPTITEFKFLDINMDGKIDSTDLSLANSMISNKTNHTTDYTMTLSSVSGIPHFKVAGVDISAWEVKSPIAEVNTVTADAVKVKDLYVQNTTYPSQYDQGYSGSITLYDVNSTRYRLSFEHGVLTSMYSF